MRLRMFFLAVAVIASPFAEPRAQSPSPVNPGVVAAGSPDVSVGGAAAARQGDATKDGSPIVKGSPDVFINGRPAETAGGRIACGGAVIGGASNVFVNGKPLARAGDATTGCARK
jgi:uncharacterized Zn-binding protein involved in type VI secretion